METELINLELEEVSLVPAGDDPLAKVAIIKCRYPEETTKGNKMDEDKIKAYMEKEQCTRAEAMKALGYEMEKSEDVKSLEADIETLKAENERLRKGLIENGFVIKAEAIEKKAPQEFLDIDGEQINKADIPAPILKKLEEAEVAKAEAEIAKKVQETLPNFKPDVAHALMKFDLSEEILEVLSAADKLFEGATEELGKADVDDLSDPEVTLSKMVDAYALEHDVTKAQAYAGVAKTAEGKALINKTYKKD